MSVAVLIAVGLLGGAGAVARFAVDGAVAAHAGRAFPWGTLAVNLTGAFALGAVVGIAVEDDAYRLIATGLLGSYTTFSTWVFESQRLGEDGELRLGLANVVVSLVLGVVVVWLGRELGSLL